VGISTLRFTVALQSEEQTSKEKKGCPTWWRGGVIGEVSPFFSPLLEVGGQELRFVQNFYEAFPNLRTTASPKILYFLIRELSGGRLHRPATGEERGRGKKGSNPTQRKKTLGTTHLSGQ